MLKTLLMALLLFSQGMTLASTPQWLENDLNDARELLLKSKVRAEMTSTEDSEFTTYLHLDAAKKKLSK